MKYDIRIINLTPEALERLFDNHVMVKCELHPVNILYVKPFGSLSLRLVDIDERNIGTADNPHPRVALHAAKSIELFAVNIGKARFVHQHPAERILKSLLFPDKTTGQAVTVFIRITLPLYQQNLQRLPVQLPVIIRRILHHAEHNGIDRDGNRCVFLRMIMIQKLLLTLVHFSIFSAHAHISSISDGCAFCSFPKKMIIPYARRCCHLSNAVVSLTSDTPVITMIKRSIPIAKPPMGFPR